MTSPGPQEMTVEQYAALQLAITERLAAQVAAFSTVVRGPALTAQDWSNFLDLLFPFVSDARTASANLARRFFDSQYRAHIPGSPVPGVFLAEYKPAWFREEMEPARKGFSKAQASDYDVSRVVLRTMKAVENGGRRTITRAVEDLDGWKKNVVGWARVATGRETCDFCLMLVSRGPIYQSASTAGLDLDDTSASQLHQKVEAGDLDAADEMSGLMTRWHEACDCKVVPVFSRSNWPGRDAQQAALKAWKKATRGFSGRDAQNAFRRAIERGDVDIESISGAA